MTAPRQVLPGATYLFTRRCTQREFLLRPSKATNDTLTFLLAEAARRYGIRLHAFCVMSNHLHLVLTDPDARLPEFARFLNAFIARVLNASLGRWEAFWGSGSYSAVRLTSPADVVDKTAYVLANPASAGLVRSGRLWPGLWSDPERIGAGPVEVARPSHFFAKKGAVRERVWLELTAPPGFESAAEFRQVVSAALAVLEEQAARRFNGRFLGAAAVLKQKPQARPASVEPRRNMHPRVAARDTSKRIEALSRLAEFVRSYRRSWAARRAGDSDVVFPAGTYLLRVMHGVRCLESG